MSRSGTNEFDSEHMTDDNDCLTQPCALTQQEFFSDHHVLDSEHTILGGSPEGEAAEEEQDCWGLLRRKGVDQECRLLHRVVDGRRNDVYCIGRKETCDITIPDPKVSSVHCLIYCAYSEEDMLTMYVEDCSANGTYVNSSLIRLKHGERTVLKSGDEIYLMNPRFVKGADLVSFVFINMRDRQFALKKVDDARPPPLPLPATGTGNGSGGVPVGSTEEEHHRRPPLPSSSLPARTSTHGTRIEDLYVIGEPIGSGMCGQVHVCTHKASKSRWAVKIIDTKKFGKSPGLSVGELREEADLMRVLHHPNIIRIQDTFETSSKIFIVMELVSGGDLFDRIIDRGKYSEPRARLVMRMLLEAVKYLHDHNIVHRDLKPENILLVDESEDAQVKLTDFGLAKKASREGLKTFCGTPQYFAPEVLERKEGLPATSGSNAARYGFKADMWSLGVVLYIMLSGAFPFDEENLYDQLREANYSVNGVEWRSVTSHAKHFVRSLMTLNPADRLDVTQALDHPWMQMTQPGAAGPSARRQQQQQLRQAEATDSARPGQSQQEQQSKRQRSVNNKKPAPAPAVAKRSSTVGRGVAVVDGKEAVRTKTFSPVFWSNRPAFSATVSGGIPRDGLATAATAQCAGPNSPLLAAPTTPPPPPPPPPLSPSVVARRSPARQSLPR